MIFAFCIISQGNGKCQPSHSLVGYGAISVGDMYHLVIGYNASLLSVHVSGGDRPDWAMTWARSPTAAEWLGTTAHLWFMSGKFGASSYNRGNGTFRNIVLTSYTPTPEPMMHPSTQPSVDTANANAVETADE